MSIPPALRDLLALSLVPGLGPRLTQALLEHFGSPIRARHASAKELMEVPRIGEKTAQQFAETLQKLDIEAEIRRLNEHGIHLLGITETNYPPPLRNIPDPPHLLYARGDWHSQDANAVAIVGSRECTPYGLKQAKDLARSLARAGYCVVSGLARGIDGAAHQGALEGNGRTIAVHPGGLARIFPPTHKDLAEQIAGRGLLISEAPMEVPPEKGMFHARNRLISGLSLATVVIEANDRSGALITARHCAEQGRDVFVVPANVDSVASAGSLQLLRKGAKLIRGIDDLLEDLRGLSPASPVPFVVPTSGETPASVSVPVSPPTPVTPVGLDPAQSKIWDWLTEARSFDSITRQLQASASEVAKLLFQMELKRWVRRLPGNVYERRT